MRKSISFFRISDFSNLILSESIFFLCIVHQQRQRRKKIVYSQELDKKYFFHVFSKQIIENGLEKNTKMRAKSFEY